MKLNDLLSDCGLSVAAKYKDVEISSLTADSRKVADGSLFVALCGETVDGHDYIDKAIAQGAAAIVVQKDIRVKKSVPVIRVTETREALALFAASFNGHPERKLILVGITGTNGKTTTSYLIDEIFKQAGIKAGVIGTVNYRYAGKETPAPFTTPEPVALFELFRRMTGAGVSHLVMEVSSHALSQKRIFGLKFDVAVFTNLSRDHLDFHGHMDEYFAAKKELFTSYLKPGGVAVIVDFCCDDLAVNADKWGRLLAEDLRSIHPEKSKKNAAAADESVKIITCGQMSGTVYAEEFHYDLNGMQAEVVTPDGSFHLDSRLAGEFNLKNILAAAGVGIALGIKGRVLQKGLTATRVVPGRLERVESAESRRRGIEIFVDYAHTPDALENVLATIRDLEPKRLIVIFGCGGDRDKGKRPQMGAVAVEFADIAIITSDNPRSEDPLQILQDIEQGILNASTETTDVSKGVTISRGQRQRLEILMKERRRGYDIIESRRQAISAVLRHAAAGDVILISGKGHENYQITRDGKYFFDDRLEAGNQLAVVNW